MKTTTQFHSSSIFSSWRTAGLGLVLAAQLATSSFGAGLIWNGGGGANGNWSNTANWSGFGPPANGDTLVFQGAVGLNTTNNIAGLTLNQIQFRNGGFAVSGNSFTLTNSIIATNTSGANTISCTNITLATSDVLITVSNLTTLTISSHLLGSVGVVKTGAGTLAYLVPSVGFNTYSGTTAVNEGLLTLDLNNLNAGFGGPLVIGDGSGTAATVRNVFNDEIPNSVPITINRAGLLDLNNNAETIGTNLVLNDNGSITTGAGTLTLSPGATVTANPNTIAVGNPTISGKLNVNSSTCTFTVNPVAVSTASLIVPAVVNGAATITKNGTGFLGLSGANLFSGQMNVAAGTLGIANTLALGSTNSGTTVSNTATLFISSVSVTNENLTIASTGIGLINASGANVWACTNITLVGTNTFEIDGTSLDLQSSILGTGGFAKTGASTLRLSGSNLNTYSGNTAVNAGVLELNGFNVIRFGTLFIGDGVGGAGADIVRYVSAFGIHTASTVVIANSGLLDLNGFNDDLGTIYMDGATINTGAGTLSVITSLATLDSANSGSTINGKIILSTIPVAVSNILTINAVISGTTLTKTGPGTLHALGVNTYTGITSIQQGLLEIQNASGLGTTNGGTVVSSGATLYLTGSFGVTNEMLTLNGPGYPGWGALDSETGGGTNYWVGPITLNAVSDIAPYKANSFLRLNGPISGAGGINEFTSASGNATLVLEGGTANTYAGTTTVSDSFSTLLLNKTVSSGAVPGNLVINGTVRLGASDQIADTADVLINAGGVFDLVNSNEGIDTLHGSGGVTISGGGWIKVGGNNGSSTFDGVIFGPGYGVPGGYTLGKLGSGTFTMNGNNTFTNGAYHVFTPGKLLMNGSSPQVPVIVDNGSTFGGSGTVGTIAANGTLAPGNSPGTLTSSNVTFSATGTFAVELTGPTAGVQYDQLNVRGTNALANAALIVNMNFTNPVAIGQQFTILNNDGAEAITGIFAAWPEGSIAGSFGYAASLSYIGGTGNDVVFTLIDVPGAASTATVTSGNGSHTIDPNECNSLNLVITNKSGALMTGINATLSTTTPGVLITQPYSTYANIAANGKGTNLAPFQISTLPSFVCGTTINLQLIVNATSGDFITSFTLNTGGVSGSPLRFDNNTATGIPDIGTIDSTNVASGFSGPLEKVVVSLYITHTFDSDLTNLSLISPDGTTVPLTLGIGAGANFGVNAADTNRTTFDDAATTAITAGSPPFVGTFRPQGSLANFNFNGTPNGNWKLHIADGFGGTLGTLRNWSLFLYPVACNAGGGACDPCLSVISNSISAGDPLQTGRWVGNLVTASCGVPKPWPGTAAGSLHYDVYSFTNTSGADACVSVQLQSVSNIMATAYLNSFDPVNITNNYAGDAGNSTHGDTTTFSCTVPAGGKLLVTVNEVTASASTQPYLLTVYGLPCPDPTLAINKAAATNSVRVNWPTSAGGYQLEAINSLSKTNWAAVTNEPLVNLGRYNVTNTMNPTNSFYRLKKP